MKGKFMNKMSRKVNKIGFKVKQHSPEILITAGVIGVVASGVMACKATTKVNDIITETKEQLEPIHAAGEKLKNNEELMCSDGTQYTKEDNQKDLTIVYIQTGVKLVKLYAPSVALGALSLGAIITSHKILSKRNVALAAAYAAVDRGFKEYRGRVIERFGKELDRELRYNIKNKEIEETTVDGKGKEKVTKKNVEITDVDDPSDYAKFYDAGCTGWTKDPEANLIFLKQQQNYANDLLQTRGYVFLNEVYDMLGIPRTKAGQIVGWIYDEECPNGDNVIDFGIYESTKATRDFVNGYERTILLDFNVDGPILDKFWMLGLDKFGSGNI